MLTATGTAPERAVVTGLGIVAPNGLGSADYWAATLRGQSGIARLSRFDPSSYPTTLGGEISGFATRGTVPGRLVPQTDRWTHFGLYATELALTDAGVDPAELDEYDMAVVTASSSGGTEFGQREIQALWSHGPDHVGAYQSIAWFYAATTGQISIRHGMRGPCGVLAAEQAGGLDALAHARRLLGDGPRLVVSGGTDASLCPYGLVAQQAGGRLSPVTDPARAYLPFDRDATGYVPGEGGAIMIVEAHTAAAARGARIYGEVAGHAATFDPGPRSGRPPALRRAVELALRDAAIPAEAVDVVFADGAGVPELDRVEAEAIEAVFGPYGVPVTVPKTLTGRLYAGGGSLDAATALLCLRDGVIPPTAGVDRIAADYRLDLVTGAPRTAPVRTALVLARGYGGFNSALVLRAPGSTTD
ncbi:ketosynthase chain-length factor [Actinoplanes sp. CA-051413]|uniref:ketosynthase chain-length factor n=1 Tax=Actinoplanes sp. CA-051413 TaxID=3239899 RepID=UPI003D98768B